LVGRAFCDIPVDSSFAILEWLSGKGNRVKAGGHEARRGEDKLQEESEGDAVGKGRERRRRNR